MSLPIDPLKLIALCWPHIKLYDKQAEILYSLQDNDDTVVPAGNMLGKDFMAGLAVLYFFLSRSPCRVVTTSVDQGQLEKVLWGEINNFIQTSVVALPLKVNFLDIKKIRNGSICPRSYLIGRVAAKEEGLLGHHLPRGPKGAPRTLIVYDEGSGINHGFKGKTDTWAHRTLTIGNPFPCENFFKHAVKGVPGTKDRGGDILNPDGKTYFRKVIRIRAEDSPNVRVGLACKARGIEPPDDDIIPGVLSYREYLKRRQNWDKVRQTVSLDANFYEGADALLYPPDWLDRAERVYAELGGRVRRARGVGVDPAEGGDSTSYAAVDEYGIIAVESEKTPDTSVIPGHALAFAQRYGCAIENIIFDAGGGGKQHADALVAKGYFVRTIRFGEPASADDRFARRMRTTTERKEEVDNKYIYKNRRAEMYGILRQYLDPANREQFGIPVECAELRRQMAPLPLWYDDEGRLYLPPKKRKPDAKKNEARDKITIDSLIGCSPDELDAAVMAIYGMVFQGKSRMVGAAF